MRYSVLPPLCYRNFRKDHSSTKVSVSRDTSGEGRVSDCRIRREHGELTDFPCFCREAPLGWRNRRLVKQLGEGKDCARAQRWLGAVSRSRLNEKLMEIARRWEIAGRPTRGRKPPIISAKRNLWFQRFQPRAAGCLYTYEKLVDISREIHAISSSPANWAFFIRCHGLSNSVCAWTSAPDFSRIYHMVKRIITCNNII